MPATPSQIQQALKTKLETISGLRAADLLPDNFNPPMAIPALESVTYHRAFAGGDAVHDYSITVIVGAASERVAQKRLDDYLMASGATSIRSALETDPTLGGVVSSATVATASGISNLDIVGNRYLTVTFAVTVHP